MSVIETESTTHAAALAHLFEARRSTRRLVPAIFPPDFVAELHAAVRRVPSAFNAQPWRIVALHERNAEFWDTVTAALADRLEGDRRERYLRRAENMRHGGMTLLIFEDVARGAPQDGLSAEEARDQAAQSIGMAQFALWMTITARGLATSLQHWHVLIEDVCRAFVGLPTAGYRLVSFMPVGAHGEEPGPRWESDGGFARERIQIEDMVASR